MMLLVNISSRNCWKFLVIYCICINLFKILSIWGWYTFILAPISPFPADIKSTLLTFYYCLVQFSQERIYLKEERKKKTNNTTNEPKQTNKPTKKSYSQDKSRSEFYFTHKEYVMTVIKTLCCAGSLTAPFPLLVIEIWEVRQILPAPTNKDLHREITWVRNHVLTL